MSRWAKREERQETDEELVRSFEAWFNGELRRYAAMRARGVDPMTEFYVPMKCGERERRYLEIKAKMREREEYGF